MTFLDIVRWNQKLCKKKNEKLKQMVQLLKTVQRISFDHGEQENVPNNILLCYLSPFFLQHQKFLHLSYTQYTYKKEKFNFYMFKFQQL